MSKQALFEDFRKKKKKRIEHKRGLQKRTFVNVKLIILLSECNNIKNKRIVMHDETMVQEGMKETTV